MRYLIAMMAALFLAGAAGAGEWYWRLASGGGEWILWHLEDGREHQMGNYVLSSGVYRPYHGGRSWGKACLPPVNLPDGVGPMRAQNHGMDWYPSARENKVHYGGDVKKLKQAKPAQPAPKATPQQGVQAPVRGADVQVPEFTRMPSITIVSADEAKRQAILHDFETAPALVRWKDRVKAYAPDNFALATFKLDQDQGFQDSGLLIAFSPPPDENNRAPVHSFYAYGGAEDLGGRLRDVDPDYNPNGGAGSGGPAWSATHIALAVGLGVAALFCLIGGVLRWRSL